MNNNITAMIFTFNEERRLPFIYDNLKEFCQIIVFDGGSSDGTEKFCNDNNISPDFIHIDVEGAEYNVFMKLGEHRPKGIWVEMIGYRYYQNGRSDRSEIEDIDYELDDLLKSYGYYAAFQSNDDWLYLHKDAELKNKNYKN